MANLVGDKPLTPAKRDKLVAQLKDILEQLKPHGTMLDKDSRKRTLRPRKGAEPHMQRVHDLALKHGVALKNISLDGMAADLELAKQFQPIEDEARTVLTFAEDTGTQAGSEGWEAFLAYYGVLSSIADRNPELAAELDPVIKFMATGPRQKEPPVEKCARRCAAPESGTGSPLCCGSDSCRGGGGQSPGGRRICGICLRSSPGFMEYGRVLTTGIMEYGRRRRLNAMLAGRFGRHDEHS